MLHFGVAFSLFVLNQLATAIPNVADETDGDQYLLRVVGFMVIIAGIIDKNRAGPEAVTEEPVDGGFHREGQRILALPPAGDDAARVDDRRRQLAEPVEGGTLSIHTNRAFLQWSRGLER